MVINTKAVPQALLAHLGITAIIIHNDILESADEVCLEYSS